MILIHVVEFYFVYFLDLFEVPFLRSFLFQHLEVVHEVLRDQGVVFEPLVGQRYSDGEFGVGAVFVAALCR